MECPRTDRRNGINQWLRKIFSRSRYSLCRVCIRWEEEPCTSRCARFGSKGEAGQTRRGSWCRNLPGNTTDAAGQRVGKTKIENDADLRYLGFAKNGDRLAETFPRRLVQSSVPMLARIWSIAKVLIIVIKKTTYHFILMINTGALLDKLLHNLHMTLGSCSLERRVPRLIRGVRMIRIILMIRVAMRTAMFKNVNDDENSQNPGATHRSRQG